MQQPPIQRQPVVYSRQVQVVEQTAKRWKAIQAAGMCITVISIVLSIPAYQAESVWALRLTVCTTMAGVVVYYSGKIAAWWHHG